MLPGQRTGRGRQSFVVRGTPLAGQLAASRKRSTQVGAGVNQPSPESSCRTTCLRGVR